MLKKIVVLGPESTGKSTLCEQLAAHYKSVWVKEYARGYLLENGTEYTFDNLLDIARGQVGSEELAIGSWQLAEGNGQRAKDNRQQAKDNRQQETDNEQRTSNLQLPTSNFQPPTPNPQPPTSNPQPIFIDTDMYVLKVWCEFVFEKCHHWILNRIVERTYDLYLLCNIDLPWVKDELREYPDLVTREKLYHHYKDIMVNQNVPWVDISGGYEERFEKAVRAVDGL